MKSIYILLTILVILIISCADDQIVLEKQPISGGVIGGLVYEWSISQKSTGDYTRMQVGTYYYDKIRYRYIRRIYFHKEMSGEVSSLSADIAKEDWIRIEYLVKEVFATRPDNLHCDCCDEKLPYHETLNYAHGIHECILESMRIEGCTDEDIELIRVLFKELKEVYFPEESIY